MRSSMCSRIYQAEAPTEFNDRILQLHSMNLIHAAYATKNLCTSCDLINSGFGISLSFSNLDINIL